MTCVTFLTDFGLQDDFVGTCHGVIARIAPEARVIDVTHGIPPQAVLQGAVVLLNTSPYMPAGVHLAVVDPDVGGNRRAVAVATVGGRTFVGPDNGLLMLAADHFGATAAHELTDPRYQLDRVSHTFHARDVFAPAAAHLAAGVAIAELGPALDPADLVRVSVPDPAVGRTQVSATVLAVDRFGNMQLNLDRSHSDEVGIVPGARVELQIGAERYYAVAARTFADARPGDLILYEDSYRNLSIAINGGNAAAMFGIAAGRDVRIHLEPS
jgi:S-adenosyl-L-methionine hydrolase (adenosine-forming)